MTLSTATVTCFKKFASFSGRASRSEFWLFGLFLTLVGLVQFLITTFFAWHDYGQLYRPLSYWGTGVIRVTLFFFALVVVSPILSVSVRRLHDLDRSGWWYWMELIPIAGPVLLIVWCCAPGTAGSNRFGADPLRSEKRVRSFEQRIWRGLKNVTAKQAATFERSIHARSRGLPHPTQIHR